MTGDLLILAPHIDDESIGSGGLIARWREEDRPVHMVAFSAARKSIPKGYEQDVTREEFARAAEALGVAPPCIRVLNEPVRRFPERRQDILEEMLFLVRDLNPATVIIPSGCDCHQDHQVVHHEAVRAFKRCTILGYEPAKNGVDAAFRPQLYVRLTPEQMDRKLKAIECHKSQLSKDPEIPDMARTMGYMRGYQCGADYAEAYEVIRCIV